MSPISDIIKGQAYSRYEQKLEREIRQGRIPAHVAVIMDGNRRYAEETLNGDAKQGHQKGKEKLEEVLEWCMDLGVKILTVYAFSTENFSRKEDEVDFLMDLLEKTMFEFAEDERIHKNRVKLKVIGDINMMPDKVADAIRYAEERTSSYSDFHLNMAIAYGGRQEIKDAIKIIAQKVKDGELEVDDIDESLISGHMYSPDLPDPDLVLRTSGELRVSNFLLWQLAYSELHFSDVYWPGFRKMDLMRAIRSYQLRSRRFGQ
ncbi:MAG: di-trans,poly-cis-decaprenylcistransferase [Methanomassiliicoccaceae archaeon]|jgi:tritrans,polycis-undecaprenyl-diphosphate synthase [geranylgeranyl-diphosphate specific]|nr:di-trans,poly-cis-decaprenylcistransferase [Methanomassiliicoccaceae archaeon]